REPLRLGQAAMAALEAYPWPGNVRQLSNALEFAMVHADGPVIEPRHLPPEIDAPPGRATRSLADLRDRSARPRAAFGNRIRSANSPQDEWALIQTVLGESGGNRAEAARRLGMSRTTLWKRLKSQGFDA